MSISSVQQPGSTMQPARAKLPLAQARALIHCARPGLAPDAPEFRCAVLLLLIRDTGLNVHRLTLRTGFPREFVAQCLRRLTDNAWVVDGEARSTWCDHDPASCDHFWMDVEVALGRSLRRLSADGSPEWAPVRGWVKDFEYRSARVAEPTVHNEYREAVHHDPEPVFWTGEEAEEEAVVEVPAARAAPATPEPLRFAALPGSPAGCWLGQVNPQGPDATGSSGMLLEAWTDANWLM